MKLYKPRMKLNDKVKAMNDVLFLHATYEQLAMIAGVCIQQMCRRPNPPEEH